MYTVASSAAVVASGVLPDSPPNMKLLIPYQLLQCGSRATDAYIS